MGDTSPMPKMLLYVLFCKTCEGRPAVATPFVRAPFRRFYRYTLFNRICHDPETRQRWRRQRYVYIVYYMRALSRLRWVSIECAHEMGSTHKQTWNLNADVWRIQLGARPRKMELTKVFQLEISSSKNNRMLVASHSVPTLPTNSADVVALAKKKWTWKTNKSLHIQLLITHNSITKPHTHTAHKHKKKDFCFSLTNWWYVQRRFACRFLISRYKNTIRRCGWMETEERNRKKIILKMKLRSERLSELRI